MDECLTALAPEPTVISSRRIVQAVHGLTALFAQSFGIHFKTREISPQILAFEQGIVIWRHVWFVATKVAAGTGIRPPSQIRIHREIFRSVCKFFAHGIIRQPDLISETTSAFGRCEPTVLSAFQPERASPRQEQVASRLRQLNVAFLAPRTIKLLVELE